MVGFKGLLLLVAPYNPVRVRCFTCSVCNASFAVVPIAPHEFHPSARQAREARPKKEEPKPLTPGRDDRCRLRSLWFYPPTKHF